MQSFRMPHQTNSVHSHPFYVVAGMAPETTSGMAQERNAGQAQPSSDCGADKPGSSAGSGAGDGAAAEQEAPPAAAEDSSGAAPRLQDAASASSSEAEDVSQAAALVLPENFGATIQQWIGRLKASGRRKADLLDLLPQLSGGRAALAAALAAAAAAGRASPAAEAAAAPAGGAAPPAGGAGSVGTDPPVDDSAGDDAQSQAQMWLGLLRRLATMGAKDVSTSAPALLACAPPASSRFLLSYKCIAQV